MSKPLPPWQWTEHRSYHVERHWGGGVRAYWVDWNTCDGVGERHSFHLDTIGF